MQVGVRSPHWGKQPTPCSHPTHRLSQAAAIRGGCLATTSQPECRSAPWKQQPRGAASLETPSPPAHLHPDVPDRPWWGPARTGSSPLLASNAHPHNPEPPSWSRAGTGAETRGDSLGHRATQQGSGGRVPSWGRWPLTHCQGHTCTHRNTPKCTHPLFMSCLPSLAWKHLESGADTPAPRWSPG